MNYRMKCTSTMLWLIVFSFPLAACGRDVDKDKPTLAPEKPAVSAVNPNQVAKIPSSAPPEEFLPVTGKVLEIQDTGSFLFVSLDWQGKQVWATVPGVDLKVGEMVTLDHAALVKKFHSKVLNRTFDELIFASSVVGKSPRLRMANNADPKDPRNRRSGKLMAGLPLPSVPPAPVPARPVAKPGGKADH